MPHTIHTANLLQHKHNKEHKRFTRRQEDVLTNARADMDRVCETFLLSYMIIILFLLTLQKF